MKHLCIRIIAIIFTVGCATNQPKDTTNDSTNDPLYARTFEEAERIAIDIFWVYNDDIVDEIIAKFPSEVMAIWGTMHGEFSDEIASNYEVKMARHGLPSQHVLE